MQVPQSVDQCDHRFVVCATIPIPYLTISLLLNLTQSFLYIGALVLFLTNNLEIYIFFILVYQEYSDSIPLPSQLPTNKNELESQKLRYNTYPFSSRKLFTFNRFEEKTVLPCQGLKQVYSFLLDTFPDFSWFPLVLQPPWSQPNLIIILISNM